MKPVELIGHVDEQHRLHVELPPDVHSGPVKVIVQPATEEDEEGDWQALINHSWAADWSDPREDIYTLEDGKLSHESRRDSLGDASIWGTVGAKLRSVLVLTGSLGSMPEVLTP